MAGNNRLCARTADGVKPVSAGDKHRLRRLRLKKYFRKIRLPRQRPALRARTNGGVFSLGHINRGGFANRRRRLQSRKDRRKGRRGDTAVFYDILRNCRNFYTQNKTTLVFFRAFVRKNKIGQIGLFYIGIYFCPDVLSGKRVPFFSAC